MVPGLSHATAEGRLVIVSRSTCHQLSGPAHNPFAQTAAYCASQCHLQPVKRLKHRPHAR
eukprot:2914-Eustigmatos_ZCMA.PRE.1